MNQIYQPPQSDLEIDKYESLVNRLLKEQSLVAALLSAFAGTLGMLIAFSFAKGAIPLFVFVLPGLIGGLFIKILGRPVTVFNRLIPSFLCGAVVMVWFGIDGISIYTVVLPFLNILCCLVVSRRRLNFEEEKAMYRYKHGLLKSQQT